MSVAIISGVGAFGSSLSAMFNYISDTVTNSPASK
ncbi:Flp family type IVb pilin [Rhizobium jaguaris]